MNKWLAIVLRVEQKKTPQSAEALEVEIKRIKQKLLEDAKDSAKQLEALHELALKELDTRG